MSLTICQQLLAPVLAFAPHAQGFSTLFQRKQMHCCLTGLKRCQKQMPPIKKKRKTSSRAFFSTNNIPLMLVVKDRKTILYQSRSDDSRKSIFRLKMPRELSLHCIKDYICCCLRNCFCLEAFDILNTKLQALEVKRFQKLFNTITCMIQKGDGRHLVIII